MHATTTPPSTGNDSLFKKLQRRLREDLLSPPSSQYDSLNGLRALASFLVISYHVASFSGNIPYGPDSKDKMSLFYQVISAFWSGLDFFFVLSGFLIGRILMSSATKTGTIEFPRFFIRRSMRVFPAYYVVLTLVVFWYTQLDIPYAKFLLVGPQGWEAMRDTSWMNYLYVMNYTFHSGAGNPMSWAWSLCVEEHFYLALPLILAISYRSKHKAVVPTVLIIATLAPVIGRAVQYALEPTLYMQDGFYFRTHNRIDEIMVGVLIAYLFVHNKAVLQNFAKRAGSLCWIVGCAMIVSVWIFGGIQQTGAFAVVFQFSLVALGTGLLVINGLFLDNRFTRVLAHRAWYPWARVSYGMYLTHPFLLFALMHWEWAFPQPAALDPLRFLFLYVLTMLSSAVLAAIMFVVLERPLIDWGVRLSDRYTAPPHAAGKS